MGFELTQSVVIDTNCIGSCKSNYQTIVKEDILKSIGTALALFFMVKVAVALHILKVLKKYNTCIRTLSVKKEEKQRLSRVKILLSYQAVETKYGLSRVKTILSHLE